MLIIAVNISVYINVTINMLKWRTFGKVSVFKPSVAFVIIPNPPYARKKTIAA